jgi:phenylalanyl-tRNA synthetase beta chain
MYISRNWLEKYINISEEVTPDVVRRQFSRCVAEVEGYEDQGAAFEHMVVGRIKKVVAHPNADSLQLCQVDVGEQSVQVVCGGSNVAKNMFVAVALPGAQVRWHGEGDLITLKKAVIRGEESIGMICASSEIGLQEQYPNEGKEILDLGVLNQELAVGQPLAELLAKNDVIFEIENKTLSNRPDLWGHYGIAREFAAVFSLDLQPFIVPSIEYGKKKYPVTIENFDDCSRYMGVVIKDVVIEESPAWLKNALEAVGVRSINTIVDITNYVMLTLGQPLHAFDAKTLKGDHIAVRRAQKGETLTLLDETELTLDESLLVIADADRPVALAGIMGGAATEVTDKTTSIFLEAAHFNAGLIRRSSTAIGKRTDASMRFEKSLDAHGVQQALEYAISLILEMNPEASIVSEIVDVHHELPEPVMIETSYDEIQNILGSTAIKPDFIKEKLAVLGFEFTEESDAGFTLKVPSWRATKDISLVADVAEEILRMYGYDAINSQAPMMSMEVAPKNKHHSLLYTVRDFCSFALGMNEVYTYSFVAGQTIEAMGNSTEGYLALENPIAQDRPYLRQSLLANLLEATAQNLKFYSSVAMYEIGRIFLNEAGQFKVHPQSDEMLPRQPFRIGGVFVPEKYDVPFFDAKNAVTRLLDFLHVSYSIVPVPTDEVPAFMHPHRCAYVEVLHEKIGMITEVHPAVAKKFGIKKRIAAFELDFDVLVKLGDVTTKYKEPSKYPSVNLDVSMTVDQSVSWQQVKDVVYSAEKDLVDQIELFDVFENESMRAAHKKSLAFRITYQSYERTLEHDEVQMIHAGIVNELEKTLQAELRS